jgi:predicted permease
MFLQDLRYAVRTLARSPGFAAVAIACLSLGIGVNATIFSVVDGIILNPHPFPDADRLSPIHSTSARLGVTRGGISYPDYLDLRDAVTTSSEMGAFTQRSLTVSDGQGDPERYFGALISASLFEVIGAPPAFGRSFGPDDDRPGAEPVVLLSDEVWRRRYNADPAIVGKAVNINGRATTIVGVMPPRFAFPQTQRLWIPLAPQVHTTRRTERLLQVIVKMKPGVSLDQLRSDLAAVGGRLSAAYPESQDWSYGARPLREWMLPGNVQLMLFTMMGAVTLVLMIACSNVANLLLARASVRHREISIRSALGAGRWRIVRQLLTEAILIGLLSAPLGIGLAWIGIRWLDMSIPPDSVPYFIHWSLDSRSIVYTVAISMLTGIVFGLAPAVQAARTNLQESLKEGGRGAAGGSRAWLRSSLVVVQVSLSLVLLVGASMFVHSFLNLQKASLGFDTAPLMTLRFFMAGSQYETPDSRARRVEDITARVEALPGVQAVFASNFIPAGNGGDGGSVLVEGRPVEAGKEPGISLIAASPHFRKTLDIALVRGRDFRDAETATRTPIALVNQAMAKRLWPDEDPVGRRFRLTGERIPDWFTVIGIVADFQHGQPETSDEPVFPAAYVPYPFGATPNTGLTIRVSGEPTRITAAVREQIRAADPQLPVFQISSMEELRRLSFWQQRLFGGMFSVFGVVALILAAIGVYGVLSYSVSQRTQEIGVRMALGAGRRDVLGLVVGYGLKLAALGVLIGVFGAYLATMPIRTMLYNVTPTDPISFGGVALFLTLVALLASYIPARRATAVDPLIALRNE